jgi:DNA-binding SARP family transcriptional activator
VAPAGSGKSRLLNHVVGSYTGPVGWCDMPDPVPRTEAAFVDWLWTGLRAGGVEWAGGKVPGGVDALIAAAPHSSEPLMVVLDDVHLLDGSDAEVALAALVSRLPSSWRLIAASRMSLGVDLSRLRVSGEVVDIGPDELRFRTWEVEELFRDVYQEPLLPEDVAALTRRTAGWAAYLQLFFLATSRRPVAERRTVLGTLQHRTRLVSEYLARHVMAALDPALQDFLIRTSVLRRPSGRLADEFLGSEGGSAEMLAELERRQLFTERLADDSYRYHAVLLGYLDSKLVETLGLDGAREEHLRAARLLEREGWREEAGAAYARSEEWEEMARMLGHLGTDHTQLDEAWADALPPGVLESDPLLLMAQARSTLSRGSLDDAARILRRAEAVSVSGVVAARCRVQREQILTWAEPDRPAPPDWVGVIRRATQRQPNDSQRRAGVLEGVTGRFAEGAAAFISGDAATCARTMRSVAAQPEAPPTVVVGAAFLAMVSAWLRGRPLPPDSVVRLQEEAEAAGVRWLSRIVRAALMADDPVANETIDDLVGACERAGDRWGAAVITAIDGLRRLVHGDPGAEGTLVRAASGLDQLGAAALEASIVGYAALAAPAAGDPEPAPVSTPPAHTMGSALDVPLAIALGALVLNALGDDPGGQIAAQRILGPFGTWEVHASLAGTSPTAQPAALVAASPSSTNGAGVAPLKLRCLGAYELEVAGKPVDDGTAKPMERALLHLLSIRAGSPAHRESLVASLWPDADAEAGLHRLQVAVSSVRRLISGAGGEGNETLARSGDSYLLVLPEGSKVDVADFEQAVGRAEAARTAGDAAGERRALDEALLLYTGPLLPGDGPAEWVVEPRRWLVGLYAEATARLATLLLDDDDPRQAVRVARAGLAADRYRDELWKLLIDGAERAGNHAEAEQARRDYESILNELGV